jgi:hypothetical protein
MANYYSIASIAVCNSALRIGFVKKLFMPHCSHCWRLVSMALAVRAMIGVVLLRLLLLARIACVACRPSITGIMQSIKITSNRCCCVICVVCLSLRRTLLVSASTTHARSLARECNPSIYLPATYLDGFLAITRHHSRVTQRCQNACCNLLIHDIVLD